ncbi:MAG TPA: membrane dipeptidase [Thermoanaerobaculia bacterium]
MTLTFTRREFAAGLAALAAMPMLARGDSDSPSAAADAGWAPYPGATIIDGLSEAFDTGGTLPLTPEDLAAARESGLTAVNFTVVGPGAGFEDTVRAIAFIERAAEEYPDRYLLVRKHADIARARQTRRLGLILGFQTTEMLGADLSRLDLFRNMGVRIIQMTYNVRNLFGDGCLEPGDAGLSTLGAEAVRRMNGLGIAVDLSHCGTRTTAETIAVSPKPVLITHTGCNAVFRHPRNKDDRELRAAAERGGVVGIYLMPYLDGGSGELTPAMFLAHFDHALKVCGEDHVGIGSDQGVAPIRDSPEYRENLRKEIEDRIRRGVSAPGETPNRPPFIPEWNRVRRMERIAAALKARGHADSVIAKVCGGNFDRALKEIWG